MKKVNPIMKPSKSHPLWNEYAAKHPTISAEKLKALDSSFALTKSIKGIANGARSIEK